MREIKYRMYHKKTKIMYEVGMIDFENRRVYMKNYKEYTESSFSFSEVELMQYTGLKDKNGKEIYEGDILRIDCETMKCIGEIKYRDESACFMIADIEEGLHEVLWYQQSEYEVLGNIFDNPELLEESVNNE